MSELAQLFSPITVGRCTIRNRILQSGHVTGMAEQGLPSDRHLRYYEARARGGIGLIVMEAVAVSPHGHIIPHVVQGWRDEVIPRFRKISDAVHAHGAKIFCQAWHNGNKNSSYYSWTNSQSCSDVPSPAIGEVPDVLDEQDIQNVIRQYVDFCLRLKEGGYDGVELHFGHGYLPQQFLSPFTNIRKDRYGGSLENRLRFGLELIDATRKAVGTEFVVGLRTSADEMVPKGLSLDDMKEIAPVWAGTGHVDYLNVTIATYKSLAPVIAPMMIPPRSFVFYAAEIKQVVDIPVFTAIRINDPVMANDIIRNNEADMVVMTRATICDPEMPNKAREGRIDDIRLCIACNEGCWERITQRDSITCMQNPETGREEVFRITPSSRPRKILVAGGGVAGMEAAIVAKQRGHNVVLCEKTGELGGAVLIWTKAPARQEAAQAVRFFKHELERLGVEVRLNTEVTQAFVEKENPDAVIVATGATTIRQPLPDVVGPDAAIEIEGGAHVTAAEDVLEGKAETGRRVVIADFQNYMKGLVTAEVLADQGKEVTVVMPLPFRLLGHNPYDMDGPTHVIQLVNLTTKNVRRVADCEVKKARPGKVTIRNVFTEQEEELDADTLVLSYWRKADQKLYRELKGKTKELYKIGDCVAPRRLINAVYEGYKVAMEI